MDVPASVAPRAEGCPRPGRLVAGSVPDPARTWVAGLSPAGGARGGSQRLFLSLSPVLSQKYTPSFSSFFLSLEEKIKGFDS